MASDDDKYCACAHGPTYRYGADGCWECERPIEKDGLDASVRHLAAADLFSLLMKQRRRTAELVTELAETRAVLSDVLEAKGESWLAQLAGRREELLQWPLGGEYLNDSSCDVCSRSPSGEPMGNASHDRGCGLALMRRAIGGPSEVARQVDAAHEAALVTFMGINTTAPLPRIAMTRAVEDFPRRRDE